MSDGGFFGFLRGGSARKSFSAAGSGGASGSKFWRAPAAGGDDGGGGGGGGGAGAGVVYGAQHAPLYEQPDEDKLNEIAEAAMLGERSSSTSSAASPRPAGAAMASSAAASSSSGDGGGGGGATSPKSSAAPASSSTWDDELGRPEADLQRLRKMAWTGVPRDVRHEVWQLLLGYLPAHFDRREAMLQRKRRGYAEAVPQFYDITESERTPHEQAMLRQILVDVPRTLPETPLFHQEQVQEALTRVLYIWAIHHPASDYVQGINDLATPLFLAFLSKHVPAGEEEACDVSTLPGDVLLSVEADCYWCLTKLLDSIQDHYTPSQPGIQRMVAHLEELVKRMDEALYSHLQEQGLQFLQFSFRWMNCLLMREFPLHAIVRIWDTCLAEEAGFENFHVYVCASFLMTWSKELQTMAFQELVRRAPRPAAAARLRRAPLRRAPLRRAHAPAPATPSPPRAPRRYCFCRARRQATGGTPKWRRCCHRLTC